jgi:hypothetical protein
MKLQEIIAHLNTKEEPYSGEDLQRKLGHQNPVDLSIHGFSLRVIQKYSTSVRAAYHLIYHNGVPICIAHFYQSFQYLLAEYCWISEEIYWNILKIIKNIHSQDIRLIVQNEEWDPVDIELKPISEIILSEKQKLELAKNPDTSSGLLEFLASDENEEVRRRVAENINTPPEILEQLATDKDPYVRWFVARNPNTQSEALELLAINNDFGEYHWGIHCGVANNPNTPLKTLELFVTHNNGAVRYCVAGNPNTPTKILEVLVNDEFPNVRERAAENLKSRTVA